MPHTRQRRIRPSTSTSLTPDARSICRAGGAPTKLTSTRWVGCSLVMLASLGGHTGAAIDGIRDSIATRPAPESLPLATPRSRWPRPPAQGLIRPAPPRRPLQVRRGHPGGDLGARVDPELVQDAADVAVD